MPEISYAFKQFLFFLTLPENKKKVYREAKQLSFQERLIMIRISRLKDNDWKDAA